MGRDGKQRFGRGSGSKGLNFPVAAESGLYLVKAGSIGDFVHGCLAPAPDIFGCSPQKKHTGVSYSIASAVLWGRLLLLWQAATEWPFLPSSFSRLFRGGAGVVAAGWAVIQPTVQAHCT